MIMDYTVSDNVYWESNLFEEVHCCALFRRGLGFEDVIKRLEGVRYVVGVDCERFSGDARN